MVILELIHAKSSDRMGRALLLDQNQWGCKTPLTGDSG